MNVEAVRILLIEQRENDRIAFEQALRESHLPILITALENAAAAFEILQTGESLFDLAVVSDGPDGHSGLAFCKKLRDQNIELPVIFMAGIENELVAIEALQCGVDDYLVKDASWFFFKRLPYVIERLFRGQREKQRRIKAEAALRKSEENLYKAQEIAHIGSWSWHILSNEHKLSIQACKLFGYEEKEISTSFEDFLAYVDPDDRDSVEKARQSAVHKSADDNKPYDIEYRIKRRDQVERIIHSKGKVLRDENGVALSMVGTIQDITEWKEAEEKLKLFSKVFENTIEGVMITDPNAIITSVNPAFTEITGFSTEEAIGKKPNILRSGKQNPDFYKKMWQMLLKTGRWRGEIWNRRKSGEIYPERLTIAAIKDDEGKTTQYASVFYDITAIKQTEMEIEYKAYHDALTGLPNRQLFFDRLNQTLKRAKRHRSIVALLYIDLDNFKTVNDVQGHDIGDLLLQEVSNRLLKCSRAEDTVSRLGGDEFTIILEKINNEQEAALIADRVVTQLSKPFKHLTNETIFPSVSVGIASYPRNGENVESLLKNADIAMYHSKDLGKNGYQFFTQSLNEHIQKRAALESAFKKALAQDDILPYFQPIISLEKQEIVGLEALARWTTHQEGPMVPASEFIPLAEEKGLVVEIDKRMVEKTCLFLKRLNKMSLKVPPHISVNISAVDFERFNICRYLRGMTEDFDIDPRHIGVEITESAIIKNMALVIRHLNRLRKCGFTVSIDDFGTGYSSLSYLANLPVDILKIDRSFVMDLPENTHSRAITKAIVLMAHEMGIKVTAEGVETEGQRQFLQEIGCDNVQGFLYSPAIPEKEIEALLINPAPLFTSKVSV